MKGKRRPQYQRRPITSTGEASSLCAERERGLFKRTSQLLTEMPSRRPIRKEVPSQVKDHGKKKEANLGEKQNLGHKAGEGDLVEEEKRG